MIRKFFSLLVLAGLAFAPVRIWAASSVCNVYAVPRGGSQTEIVGGYVYVRQSSGSPTWDRCWDTSTYDDYLFGSSHDFYIFAKPADGYYFDGWYTDEGCSVQFSTVAETKATVDKKAEKTLYALFKKPTKIESVTLDPAMLNYDGSEKAVTVTVKATGDVVLGLENYDIVGATSGVVGSLTEDTVTTVKVTGKGDYTGEASASWTIAAPSGSFAAPTGGNENGYSISGNTVELEDSRFIGSTYDAQKGTWKVSMTVNWPDPVNVTWSGLTPGHAEYIDAAHAFIQVGDAVYSGSEILDSGKSTPNLTAETGKSEYTQGLGNKVSYTYFKSATYTIELSADDIEAAKATGKIERKIAAWSLAWAGTEGDKKNQYSKTGLKVTTYTLTIPIDEKLVLTDKFGNQIYPKPEHEHVWDFSDTFTDVITATCTNLDPPCTVPGGTIGIGLVAEDREYDGQPFVAVLSNATAFAAAIGQELGEIEYHDENGELLDSAPTRAGVYSASLVIKEGIIPLALYKEFAITKPEGGYTSGWELARQDLEEKYWASYDSVSNAALYASDGDTIYYRGQETSAINLDRDTDFSSDVDITVDLGKKTFTRKLAAEMHIHNGLGGTVTLVNGTLKQPTNSLGVEDIHFDGREGSSGVIVLGEGIEVVNVALVSGFLKLHANSIELRIVDGEYDIAALGVSNNGGIAITGGRFGLRSGHPIEKENLAKFVDQSCEVNEISGDYKYEVALRQITTLKIPEAKTGYVYAVSNGTEALVGELKDGTNTYEVAKGDLVTVHFTLKDRYRWCGEPENPMTIGPIAGDTVVDAGELPTAERIPLTPGDVAGPYDTALAAFFAASDNPLTPTDEVRAALEHSEFTEDDYIRMFVFKSYQSDDGKYYITYVLTEKATNDLVQSANAMAADIDLAEIAALPSGETSSLTVGGGVPGFYYSLLDGAAIADIAPDANEMNLDVLCDKDGKVSFPKVKKPSDAAGFFAISVSPEPTHTR